VVHEPLGCHPKLERKPISIVLVPKIGCRARYNQSDRPNHMLRWGLGDKEACVWPVKRTASAVPLAGVKISTGGGIALHA